MKHQNIYTELAEDFVAMMGERFEYLICLRLLMRSTELPTAATPEALLTDVCETFVRENFVKLIAFRSQKHGACHMQLRKVGAVVEALKPLCVRFWPTLNVMLSEDRDYLFPSFAYTQVMGTHYFEEAPSVTFIRYLNTMERLKAAKSAIYEKNVLYVAEVHAFNRVASIMPKEAHVGWKGKLKPGETYDDIKAAKCQWWREKLGIHTRADLLEWAGLA